MNNRCSYMLEIQLTTWVWSLTHVCVATLTDKTYMHGLCVMTRYDIISVLLTRVCPHSEQTATYKCVSSIISPGEVWMMLAHSGDSAHDLSMEFRPCLVNHPDWQNLLLNATCMDCVPWQGMISIVFCSLGLSPRWWHLRYSKLYLWEKSDIM